MASRWQVYEAGPDDLMEWLKALAATAQALQQQNPYRPRTPIGGAGAVDPSLLPLQVGARAEPGVAQRACVIYGRTPSPELPFGEVLLLALLAPEAPHQAFDEPCSPALCGQECALALELAIDPHFALKEDEVVWNLEQRFPRLQRRANSTEADLLPVINRTARRPLTGAPPLACNRWLEEQLGALKDRRMRKALYRQWLARYAAERGAAPADPLRSFQRAVEHCERRLRRTAHASIAPGKKKGLGKGRRAGK